ncbi:MAG: glutamine--fructose-6-phosphate transaminase (isomerizing) [Chloroflexota bacterium]
MCGIVGYVGPRQAAPILLDGLSRLEYRGYDSAGIALVTPDGELFVEKRAGKLANLRTALGSTVPTGTVGMGHTRWATHGRPDDRNAHPHIDCQGRVTVIHNGIIENFSELRDGLRARGHAFTSETDTEVIAHLVEEAYEGDIAAATRAALAQARGAFAIAVLHLDEPTRMIGARRHVPLIVGVGDHEIFLASDAAAVLAHTRDVIFLDEGDVAEIDADGVRITDLFGVSVDRPVDHLEWSVEAAEKGGYDHFMLKEIHEQPAAILAAITGRIEGDHIRIPELAGLAERLRDIDRIELVACGSAAYASAVGAAALQAWTGLPARWNIGSEARYSPPPLDPRTLVIAVTQSGETADTLAPTRLARERGCPVIAVTNTVGSAITREADAVLYLQAGPEIAVVATKTFVTQVTTLLLLAAAVAKARGALSTTDEAALVHALRELPEKAARAVELGGTAAAMAGQYVSSRGYMFVGRGATYPVALEGALKLKEVSYVHAEGYAAGELKHGPISLLDASVPLVAIGTRSPLQEKLISNVMEGRARDARVLMVATEGDERMRDFADDILWVPDTHEMLSPILAIIPLQLFAYHTAIARGTDVDQPRNLAKSVTVE